MNLFQYRKIMFILTGMIALNLIYKIYCIFFGYGIIGFIIYLSLNLTWYELIRSIAEEVEREADEMFGEENEGDGEL